MIETFGNPVAVALDSTSQNVGCVADAVELLLASQAGSLKARAGRANAFATHGLLLLSDGLHLRRSKVPMCLSEQRRRPGRKRRSVSPPSSDSVQVFERNLSRVVTRS